MEASSIKPSWACTNHMANAETYQTIKPPRGSARKGYFLTINTLEQLHSPALILIWLLELCIPLGNHRFRHGSSERSLETQSTWADLNRSHASMLTNQRVQMRPMHREGFIHLLHFDSCTMWLTWEELRGLMKNHMLSAFPDTGFSLFYFWMLTLPWLLRQLTSDKDLPSRRSLQHLHTLGCSKLIMLVLWETCPYDTRVVINPKRMKMPHKIYLPLLILLGAHWAHTAFVCSKQKPEGYAS